MLTYIEPETDARITDRELNNTFTLAVLLSGGERQAEAAILDAIGQVKCAELSDHELRRLSLRAAIAIGRKQLPQGAIEDSANLPAELNRVLRLPTRLRQSFVLRSLAGFSAADCEALGVYGVDEAVQDAARELSEMRVGEWNDSPRPALHSAGYLNRGTQAPSRLGTEITLDLGM
jgi:hypothetical protein